MLARVLLIIFSLTIPSISFALLGPSDKSGLAKRFDSRVDEMIKFEFFKEKDHAGKKAEMLLKNLRELPKEEVKASLGK